MGKQKKTVRALQLGYAPSCNGSSVAIHVPAPFVGDMKKMVAGKQLHAARLATVDKLAQRRRVEDKDSRLQVHSLREASYVASSSGLTPRCKPRVMRASIGRRMLPTRYLGGAAQVGLDA